MTVAQTITPVKVVRTGAGVDYATSMQAAASGGDAFPNNGQQFLLVENGGGSPITLTVVWGANGKVDGTTPTNKTYAVAAGAKSLIGPFPKAAYNDSNDLVQLTWSSVTSVKVMAYTLVPE